MSNYRRAAVPRAIYFFTVALADRRSRVLVEHPDGLRAAFIATAREHPVRVDAMVVLPDHLHAVWRLPEGDADFPAALAQAQGAIHPRRRRRVAAEREQGAERRARALAAPLLDWPLSSFHRDIRRGLVPEHWGGTAAEGAFGE